MHLTAHAQRRAAARRGCFRASRPSPAIRPCGGVVAARYARDAESASRASATSANPLEQLRSVSDPQARARIMQELDGSWNTWSEQYTPSACEQVVSQELGVRYDDYTVVSARARDQRRVPEGGFGLSDTITKGLAGAACA